MQLFAKSLVAVVALAFVLTASCKSEEKSKSTEEKKVSGPLDFVIKGIDGKDLDLAKFKGKVVLFVNVASKCGYTGQYADLEKLYEKYEKDGLVLIGVPANDFGSQEPGSNEQIREFCTTKYNVTFPMAAKTTVKGEQITPLYKYLTSKETNEKFAGEIGWNFEKFLIGRDGKVVGRFSSKIEPMSKDLEGAVKEALNAK